MGQSAASTLRFGGKKVGELTESTVTVKSNGQLIVTADDVIKSKGKATAEISYSRVRPVYGVTMNFTAAAINQTVFQAATSLPDGTIIQVEGTFDQSAIKTQVGQGLTDESGTFSGSVKVL